VAEGERARLQEEHGAHGIARQRRSDRSGVGADQIALQPRGLLDLDAHVGEVTHAGIDPVDRATGGRGTFHHIPCGEHTRFDVGIDIDGLVFERNRKDVVEGRLGSESDSHDR
jgi:hypothetical protein